MASHAVEVYLPDFVANFNYIKDKNPEMSRKDILESAFSSLKRFYPRMTSSDKGILFKNAPITAIREADLDL